VEDCSGPGISRVRRGRGFSYADELGHHIDDPAQLERIRELAITPARADVWVCPDPFGHLQATGVDAAGRRQYLYHQRWRERRDREKFERMAALSSRCRGYVSVLAGREVVVERVAAM
jgi:DNA topoisomerase IB